MTLRTEFIPLANHKKVECLQTEAARGPFPSFPQMVGSLELSSPTHTSMYQSKWLVDGFLLNMLEQISNAEHTITVAYGYIQQIYITPYLHI